MKKNTLIELLKIYMRGKMDASLQEPFQDWMATKAGQETVDEVLEDHFNDVFTSCDPDRETYADYNKLAWKLGLPERQAAIIPLHKRISVRVAAVLLPVLFVASALFFMLQSDKLRENEMIAGTNIEVMPGEFKQLQLPDGSMVIIKGGSNVTYADDFLRNREIFLRGEAFFKVEKNKEVPFRVKTRYLTVEVTGTEFNVQALPDVDKTTVSLIEGSVNVSVGDKEQKLLPSQQLELNHESGEMQLTTGDNNNWWTEPLVFRDQRLDRIFETIGTYYNVEFTGTDSLMDSRRYNIKFDKDIYLNDMLNILKTYSGQFDYSIAGQTVLIKNGKGVIVNSE